MEYLFTTPRLGLRNWQESDLKPFLAMSRDSAVMRYFPKMLTEDDCREFIEKLQWHFITYGYTYFAVDVLEGSEFIGFTGLMNQHWESRFTPCVDMGWRLKKSVWKKGYATEAALLCLEKGFTHFKLETIYAFAPEVNIPSQRVMQKLGMAFVGRFDHPKLSNENTLRKCVAYKKTKYTSNGI